MQKIRSVNILYTYTVISELLLLVNNLNADATNNRQWFKIWKYIAQLHVTC